MRASMNADYEAWLSAYSTYWENAPSPSKQACPDCGEPTLDLVFGARPGERSGHAQFWCNSCLVGISISRAPIKPGVDVVPLGTSADETQPRVPNFALVRQ
jgi:hypothetical protein